jgi:hypothetical protein
MTSLSIYHSYPEGSDEKFYLRLASWIADRAGTVGTRSLRKLSTHLNLPVLNALAECYGHSIEKLDLRSNYIFVVQEWVPVFASFEKLEILRLPTAHIDSSSLVEVLFELQHLRIVDLRFEGNHSKQIELLKAAEAAEIYSMPSIQSLKWKIGGVKGRPIY